jgi:hypothetical protein
MTHDEAIAQLQSLEQGVKEAMKASELKIAKEIVQDAKSMAPGSLKNGIYFTQTEDGTEIVGGDNLAAYVNYGTGEFAEAYTQSLPPDIRQEAYDLFFVSGKGHGHANPFFTSPVLLHSEELLPNIEEELKNLIK